MLTPPSEGRRRLTGLLEKKLRECEGLTSAIEGQIAALREVRGRDVAKLGDLDANVLTLGETLERLFGCVKSHSGKDLLRRDPGLLDELFTWVSKASYSVIRIDSDALPVFDETEEVLEIEHDLIFHSEDLAKRLADHRKHLMLNHTLNL